MEDVKIQRENGSIYLIHCIPMNVMPWFYYSSANTSHIDGPPTLQTVLKMERLLKVSCVTQFVTLSSCLWILYLQHSWKKGVENANGKG
jgi:hypothetical protein